MAVLTTDPPVAEATQQEEPGALPDTAAAEPTAATQTNAAQLSPTTRQTSSAVESPAITPPPSAATPAVPTLEPANDAAPDFADFNAKREEWRARFRAALASRPKEPARGNE